MIEPLKTYIVFCNGCFDILHVGHVRLLQWAKLYGIKQSSLLRCKLVVAINSDDSIIKMKGINRPIIPAGERKEILEALEVVDEVYIFNEPTPARLLFQLQPDCIVRGPDHAGCAFDRGVPVVIYPGEKTTFNNKHFEGTMITVFGDSILDVYQFVKFRKPSPESSGSVYEILDNIPSKYKLGGAAAVAAICKHLQNDPVLVTRFGVDEWGGMLKALLRRHEITLHECCYTTASTTYKIRHICDEFDRVKLLPDRFDRTIIDPETPPGLHTNGVLVISDYRGGLCGKSLSTMIASSGAKCVIVDPAIDKDWLQYRGAHIIKCNKAEALEQAALHFGPNSRYLETMDFEALASKLNCYLIVTNSAMDTELFHKGSPSIAINVPRVDRVVDVTGCGDTTTAALACYIDKMKEPIDLLNLVKAIHYSLPFAAKQTQCIGVNYDSLLLDNLKT